MKVAIYARVSTSDKDQEPDTQLMPLRDFCLAQGWEVYREYVDQAPANDLLHKSSGGSCWTTRPKEGSQRCWCSSWTAPSGR